MTVLVWFRRLAAWLVVGTSLAALTLGVLVPRLGGAVPYTVLTGSMTPDLPPGTLVVVRPVGTQDLRPGAVVTYQLRSGDPEVVTHRVVAVRAVLTGEVEYQTKGDANDTPDAEWVRQEQVRGELWYAVPYLGRVGTWISTDEREQLAQVVAVMLMAYAAVMFARSVVGGRRRTDEHEVDPTVLPAAYAKALVDARYLSAPPQDSGVTR